MENYKKYLIKLTNYDIKNIESNVLKYGFETIKNWFFNNIDCTRTINNVRLTCTKYFTYRDSLSSLLYLIDKEGESQKAEDLKRIINIHNINIEFEKYNPIAPLKKISAGKEVDDTEKKEKIKKNKGRVMEIFDDSFNFILNVNK